MVKRKIRKARDSRDAKKHYESKKAREFFIKCRENPYRETPWYDLKEKPIPKIITACPNCKSDLNPPYMECDLCGF